MIKDNIGDGPLDREREYLWINIYSDIYGSRPRTIMKEVAY